MNPEVDVLSRLRERLPWLTAELNQTRATTFAGSFESSSSIDVLWSTLSDTSRLNRALGIPVASFEEQQGQRRGETAYFGVPVTWDEPPWEWHSESFMVCRKIFRRGPVERVLVVMEFQVTERGTSVAYWYGWVPRGRLGRLAIRPLNAYLKSGYAKLLPALKTLDANELPGFVRKRTPRDLPPVADRFLGTLSAELTPVATRLIHYVLHADPLELDRIRPYALAASWDADPDAVLQCALLATQHGLLHARWDVLCPHCRGTRASLARLDRLEPSSRCEPCDVLFDSTADRLELTFRVDTALRHIESRVYCSAEPKHRPHMHIQVANSEARRVPAPSSVGRYRLRERGHQHVITVDVHADGSDHVVIDRRANSYTARPGGNLRLPGTSSLWVLESTTPLQARVRPADVLSLPSYRTVMGHDSLHPSIALEVGVQTLLFTDIVGSTSLYARLGDQAAFQAVRTHFTHVFLAIESRDGAVIKTIGDAVMAAFLTPESAFEAARAIAELDLDVDVRQSLHRGRCIAVNLDTGLDYFGAVVNEAAKLQAAAGAGEVALSKDLAKALGVDGSNAPYPYGTETRYAVVWTSTK